MGALRGMGAALALAMVLLASPARAGGPDVLWLGGGHYGFGAVTYSPDGRWLATTSGDYTVKLWDMQSHRLARTLGVHKQGCGSAAWSPDGRRLATTSDDRTVIVWRVPEGGRVATLTGFPGYTHGAAWSPDGSLLAFGTEGVIWLYDTQSWALIKTVETTEGGNLLTFSPDGRWLASCGAWDLAVRIYRMPGVELAHTLTGHTLGPVSVAFSRDSTLLASGSWDDTARLWDPLTGDLVRVLAGHGGPVNRVAFSPDGSLLATSSDDKTIRLWNPGDGTVVRTLVGHTTGVRAIAFSPDGLELTSTGDQRILRWRVADGAILGPLNAHYGVMRALAISGEADRVISGDDYGNLVLWRLSDGELLARLNDDGSAINAAAFSPDGQWLVTSRSNVIRLRAAEDGRELRQFVGHTRRVHALEFGPDSRTFVSASADKTARVWDIGLDESLFTLVGHTGSVGDVAFCSNGRIIATSTSDASDGTVRLWSALDGRALGTLAAGQDMAFSEVEFLFGVDLLAARSDGLIGRRGLGVVRDVLLHKRTPSVAAWPAGDVVFSAAGVSGLLDDTVRLSRISDGTLLAEYDEEIGNGVLLVRATRDGRYFAYSRADGTIVVARNPFWR